MYSNLTLSLEGVEAWFPLLAYCRFDAEIEIDDRSVNYDRDWHEDMASRLRIMERRAGVHLPFVGLASGSSDEAVRCEARDALIRSFEIARIYNPDYLVGHSGVSESSDYDHNAALRTWREALDAWPGHPPLYLENTMEREPEPLIALVQDLAALHEGTGICFDVGHWYCFANGRIRDDLERWLDAFAPYLAHVHLHDNDGSADQHKGLGKGTLPWRRFAEALKARSLRPTFALEPVNLDDFDANTAFLAGNRGLFR